jgi:hypothetical protein
MVTINLRLDAGDCRMVGFSLRLNTDSKLVNGFATRLTHANCANIGV